MNSMIKKSESVPSLLSNFLRPGSLLDRDFFDIASDMFPTRLGINVPTANITETPKEFKLELAAPGLERKDVNVEVNNHTLTISAEKKEEKKEEKEGYSRREYSFNSFCRTFELPDNIKEGNIDAKYENGVLRVVVPKLKETPVKPAHKIAVS